ncbi:hypothetical protein J14TS2_41450 [Bacillus sp. J14TS2]|uniref:ABC transporter permease n=1 Tax=Bacillus sp. J14TS2 TaxID=2807188 RepID=UPI001B2032BF|nr:ABC transporter permease [Bacillus sp. J14TS2]GIN73670.1 hypothetical protein J14TS2_41450 [Bacillus sp. J14TS2]
MSILLSFIKKELLLFLRNPPNLLVLLLMPLILITILGFSLGSILDGDTEALNGSVGLVSHTMEKEEFAQFKEELAHSSIPEEAQKQIEAEAEGVLPISRLKEVFGELDSFLTLTELSPAELDKEKKKEKYSAIIEVPAGFSEDMLASLFIGDQEPPALTIYLNEGKEELAAIVEDILGSFQEHYSVQASLGKEGYPVEESDLAIAPFGKIAALDETEPIDAFGYYTIGMGVMFVLFIASSISSRSFLEKKWNVWDRMLIANVSNGVYLLSVFLSTVIVAGMQMAILYGGAALFYGVYWANIEAFLLITLAYACTIGGISVLLMAVNYRLNSETASKLFMTAFVAVLSFLGGSFTPVSNMSKTMAQVGQLTPNGAAMEAYKGAMQGVGMDEIFPSLIVLIVITFLLIFSAWLLFPRKGRAL